MNTINFNSRETYLAWRAEWKISYRANSVLIRGLKISIKNQQRTSGSANYSDYAQLRKAVALANELLALRSESKLEAERQYQMAKETAHA